jgi:glycosyltransferase involved in cell wall biosynthesis
VRHLLPQPVHEFAGALMNVREYWSVARAIDVRRPDLVYKRHARNDVGALSAARARGVPTALEVNCLYSSPGYRRFEPLTFARLTAALERKALSLASVVLAVSSPLADEIRGLGIEQVEVLPNGANPATFRPATAPVREARARLGLPDGLTIGWAGVIRDWHGLELLLDVLDGAPEATLLVIGDGPGRASFEARASERGVRDRIQVTGRVPHHRMADYLQMVDIAVVPDERTGIASPMKLLEYMAMGLTVVAPDARNIRDLIAPGVDGVLFRQGDARDLSNAITRLAADRELRRRLGAHARLKIERERNWRRNAETVLGFLANAAAGEGIQPDRSMKRQHV